MGLFDGLTKEGRQKAAIDRAAKTVMNKYALSEDRFVAMERLRDAATEESIVALARRFSYVYDKSIQDEQEKEWVESTLVGLGQAAVEPLRKHALTADTLSYVMTVLGKLTDQDTMLKILDELFGTEPPGYTRDPQRKLQILTWLSEWDGAPAQEIVFRAAPYLADFDENVRFNAIQVLDNHRDVSAGPALVAALVRKEEESRRLRMRLAELLADTGWPIESDREAVEATVATLSGFALDGEKLVRAGAR